LFIIGASRRIETELRDRLFARLLVLPSGFYQRNKTGDLMARATNDMGAIRQATAMGFVAFVDGVFMSLAILIIIFVQNPKIALFTVIPLPAISLLIVLFGSMIGKRFTKVQEVFSRLSEIAQETIAGIRVVKAFVKEDHFSAQFSATNDEYQRVSMGLVRIFGLFFPLITFLAGLTTLILIVAGGNAVLENRMSPGDIVAMLAYLEMLIWPMIGAGFTVNIIQRGAASLKRVNEILSEQSEAELAADAAPTADTPTVPPAPTAVARPAAAASTAVAPPAAPDARTSGDLEVRGLHFSYPDNSEASKDAKKTEPSVEPPTAAKPGKAAAAAQAAPPAAAPAAAPALADISFYLPEGRTLGILGRIGSGKSTLLKLLPRLIEPPKGTIFLGGLDLRAIDLPRLRRRFGFVPQDSFLFSDSLEANIRFGNPDISAERFARVTAISTIDRDVGDFPAGWETIVGEKGLTLSGGQKQRVAISRALAMDPEILVFDDALSAVDAETEDRILEALLDERRGRTNIVISHRVSTLRHADTIIVLEGGRITQRGSHAELLADTTGFYAEIARLQELEQLVSTQIEPQSMGQGA
jgi:ATP-binding cassette subfamily B protein